MDVKKKRSKYEGLDPSLVQSVAESMKLIEDQINAYYQPIGDLVKQLIDSSVLMTPIVEESQRLFDLMNRDLVNVAESYGKSLSDVMEQTKKIEKSLMSISKVMIVSQYIVEPNIGMIKSYESNLNATLRAQNKYIEALERELALKEEENKELRKLLKEYENKQKRDYIH